MGIRDLFKKRTGKHGTGSEVSRTGTVLPAYVRSPWATSTPEALVYADVFGDSAEHFGGGLTRAEAMRVPAIAAARNRVIEHLAGRPLVDYLHVNTQGMRADEQVHEGSERVIKQPTWMTRTDNPLSMSPHQRMLETLDDLIFDGMSLWAVNRGTGGLITEAMHVPREWWQVGPDGAVTVDGEPAPADQVVLIPGPHRGLLNIAQDTIRAGLDLERAWRSRARNPAPNVILEEKEDNGMTLDEAAPYVKAVAEARRNPDGAVMFAPYRINVRIEQNSGESFLESARNAIRIDVAGYFDATAQGVEAAKNQSTLTYETAESAEAQTADRMKFWAEPIEARLSMDDVVPRGHRTRFDFTDINRSTTGTPTED